MCDSNFQFFLFYSSVLSNFCFVRLLCLRLFSVYVLCSLSDLCVCCVLSVCVHIYAGCFTAAAPIAVSTLNYFASLDIPVYEVRERDSMSEYEYERECVRECVCV